MKPWSVAKSYDRPIARRIAEEAGVPRHLFGQVKKGGPRRARSGEGGAGCKREFIAYGSGRIGLR